MAVERRIQEMIEPAIEEMGFDIVRVRYTGAKNPTLQIMVDRKDETQITVNDCADVSRAVSAIMDVEDPITSAYALEVSSPGIDRPLVRPRDYERFAGFDAKIELAHMMEGRKRFRGTILGLDGDAVVLSLSEGGKQSLPFADIAGAKLVLTDALIEWAQAEQEKYAVYDETDDGLEIEEKYAVYDETDDGLEIEEDREPEAEEGQA